MKTNDEFVNEQSNASQNASILRHLRTGKTITQMEALEWFKCFRLASRINDIKKRLNPDERIETKKVVTNTNKRVAQYRLIRRLTDNNE